MSAALHKLRVVLWGERPSTKLERNVLIKLDFFILSFSCLLIWSNYLNRVNFQNAYVSGMKEDVHFQGKQYSIVNTLFTVGYIIGQIPNNLMLQVVPANYWMPAMAILWAILSMSTAAATQPSHVMAIRFFQGIVESSTFSGVHYILGSWYTEAEIGKRSAIFSCSSQLGSLFSGVLQGSIVTSLQGYRGLQAWQWLFLLDGIIAIPIAIYGFLCFPGTPTMGRGRSGRVWFLSEEERQLAIDRLPRKPHTKMSLDLFKRVLLRWHWYAFSALFAISSMLESVGSNGIIQLWLATYPLNVISSQDRNYYPLGATSVAIVATLLAAWITDFTRKRWPVNLVMAGTLIFTAIVLLVWNVPYGLKFFAFTISGVGYAGQATNFAWCNTVVLDDQERAVVLASMNMWSNVVQAWYSIVFFPSTDAPRFHKGWIATIVVAVLTVMIAVITRHLDYREQKQRQAHPSDHLEGSSNQDVERYSDSKEKGNG
ncbi:hypothetical protein CBS101457_002646 [Exobasidium rhododendri]|nr:hypothetical protein CBS101457_002646 [Exobasidium rhododendri]